MAYTVTLADVRALCPESASISDDVVQMYIDVVAQADACLDGASVTDTIQKFIKTNAVCHFIARSQGGTIKSESDMDGASISFEAYKHEGYGLSSTTFGQNVLTSGYQSCFGFMDAQPNRFMTAVGR